jgi:hypothetical protein
MRAHASVYQTANQKEGLDFPSNAHNYRTISEKPQIYQSLGPDADDADDPFGQSRDAAESMMSVK